MGDTVRAMERNVRELVGETDVETLSAGEVLDAALDRLPAIALACSFQKEESVLLDMLLEVGRTRASSRSTRTSSFPRRTRSGASSSSATGSRSRSTKARRSAARPRSTATRSGSATRRSAARSARSSRSGGRSPALDGWITGIRRDQSPTRAETPKLGWDDRHELWKANPLADWSDDDVWALRPRARPARQPAPRPRLRFDRLHALHPPGAGRDGRWAGHDKTECGLHA